PDDCKHVAARADTNLHLDRPRLDADERDGCDLPVHEVPHLAGASVVGLTSLGQFRLVKNKMGTLPRSARTIGPHAPAPYRFARSHRLVSSWPTSFLAVSSVRLPPASNFDAAPLIMTS